MQTHISQYIVDYVIASVNPLLSLITLCCFFIPSALRDHLHLPSLQFALYFYFFPLVSLFPTLIKLIISHLISVPNFCVFNFNLACLILVADLCDNLYSTCNEFVETFNYINQTQLEVIFSCHMDKL